MRPGCCARAASGRLAAAASNMMNSRRRIATFIKAVS
jgi:hypothetical protein